MKFAIESTLLYFVNIKIPNVLRPPSNSLCAFNIQIFKILFSFQERRDDKAKQQKKINK